MSTPSLLLALAAGTPGAHPAVAGQVPEPLAQTVATVQDAEAAGFHAVYFPRTRHGLDPVQLAAAAAPSTRRIGLLPVVELLNTEPFHTATQLASLDTVSAGRAGWVLEADGSSEAAAEVGRGLLATGDHGQFAADVITTHRRLWDSWEDDAVVRDVSTGRYLDADKLHYADVKGTWFSVKGPAIIPRPPQGQLPIIAPGALFGNGPESDAVAHCRLNGADVRLIRAADEDTLLHAAAEGSAGGSTGIELEIYLDTEQSSGAQRLAHLDSQSERTSGRLTYTGGADGLVQLIDDYATATKNPADQRHHLVILHPGEQSIDAPLLASTVLPELQRRGHLADADQPTLRELFSLPVARNRFQEAS